MSVEFNYDNMMSLVNKKMERVNTYKVAITQLVDAAEKGTITVEEANNSIAYMVRDVLDVIKDIKVVLVMLVSDDDVNDLNKARCREQMTVLTAFEKMIKEGS